MKSRFPSDLWVVLLGPFLVVAIALGFGSLIYRAEQWRQSPLFTIGVAVSILLVLVAFLFFRRRHSGAASSERE